MSDNALGYWNGAKIYDVTPRHERLAARLKRDKVDESSVVPIVYRVNRGGGRHYYLKAVGYRTQHGGLVRWVVYEGMRGGNVKSDAILSPDAVEPFDDAKLDVTGPAPTRSFVPGEIRTITVLDRRGSEQTEIVGKVSENGNLSFEYHRRRHVLTPDGQILVMIEYAYESPSWEPSPVLVLVEDQAPVPTSSPVSP